MLVLRALAGIHRQQPLQALLMLGGLALSIAVVVAIDIAIGSAQQAFGDARRNLSGDSSHRVVAVSGRLDEQLYARLRMDGLRAAPVLEGRLDSAGGKLPVLGIDPLAEWQLRPALLRQGGASQGGGLLEPRAVALSRALAERLGLAAGDALTLDANRPALRVVAVLGEAGGAESLLTDIGLAQQLLGAQGQLSRVDLRLDTEQVAPLIDKLPLGLQLEASAEADQQVLGMSRAFEINLQALSLLALLVGVFLVFQSLGFLGLRRRDLVARLRALGVSRAQLGRWLLLEAATIGLIAAAVGLLLGMLLALPLQQGIARSYDALFYEVGTVATRLDPGTALKALLLGIGGALAAAWRPLREALSVEPLEGMREATLAQTDALARLQRRLPSILLALTSLGLLWLGPSELWVAFAALFGLLIALLSLLPPFAGWLVGGLRQLLAGHMPVRAELLLGGLQSGLSRTGTALAALTLAMATVVGMSAMIDSFRGSVLRWIDRSLTADVYLSPPRGDSLSAGLISELQSLDGVAAVATTLRRQITLPEGPAWLVAYDMPPRGFAGFEFIESLGCAAPDSAPAGEPNASSPSQPRLARDGGSPVAALPGSDGRPQRLDPRLRGDDVAVAAEREAHLTATAPSQPRHSREGGSPALALPGRGDPEQALDPRLRGDDEPCVAGAEGIQARLYSQFQRGALLVSEPLAQRLALAPGDALPLNTAEGPRTFPIAAVYRDYASPQGTIALHRRDYAELFDDPSISGAALFAADGELAALDAALPALLDRHPGLRASRASEIRALSLEVFARTFAITDVLRGLAGLIAAVAVLGALSALQLERQRELALLRCLGYPPPALFRLQLGQGLLLGLLAALFALPLGALLAALLTEVIQQRAFGWSMQLRIGPGPLLGTAALAAACALLAAWWPARRLARSPLPELLRGRR